MSVRAWFWLHVVLLAVFVAAAWRGHPVIALAAVTAFTLWPGVRRCSDY